MIVKDCFGDEGMGARLILHDLLPVVDNCASYHKQQEEEEGEGKAATIHGRAQQYGLKII